MKSHSKLLTRVSDNLRDVRVIFNGPEPVGRGWSFWYVFEGGGGVEGERRVRKFRRVVERVGAGGGRRIEGRGLMG